MSFIFHPIDRTQEFAQVLGQHIGAEGLFNSYRTPDQAMGWGPNQEVLLKSISDWTPDMSTCSSIFWMVARDNVAVLAEEIDRIINTDKVLPHDDVPNAGALMCVWEHPQCPYVLAAVMTTYIPSPNFYQQPTLVEHINRSLNSYRFDFIYELGGIRGENDLRELWNNLGYDNKHSTMSHQERQTHLMTLFHHAIIPHALADHLQSQAIIEPLHDDDDLIADIVWHYWKLVEMEYDEPDRDNNLISMLSAHIERQQLTRRLAENDTKTDEVAAKPKSKM